MIRISTQGIDEMSAHKKLKSLDELKIDVDILIIEAGDLNTHEDKLNLIAHIQESIEVLKNGMKMIAGEGDTDTNDEDEFDSKKRRRSFSNEDEGLVNDCIEEEMKPMPVLKRQRLLSEDQRPMPQLERQQMSIEEDFLNMNEDLENLDDKNDNSDKSTEETNVEIPKSLSVPINGKGLGHFQCEHCDFVTEKEHNLRTHMSRHNSSIKCEVCDVYFARSVNLRRHEEGVTHKARVALLNQANGNLVVSLSSTETSGCNSSSPSPQSSPIILTKPKLCPIVGCNFSYYTEEQFEDHLLQCKYCTAYFHDDEMRAQHVNDVHKDEVRALLNHVNNNDLCSKIAGSLPPDLSISIVPIKPTNNEDLETKNQETFPCHLCPKTYIRKEYLSQHLIQHTDRYKCSNCGQTFSTRRRLEGHEKNLENCAKLLKYRETIGRKRFTSVGPHDDVQEDVKIGSPLAKVPNVVDDQKPNEDSAQEEPGTSTTIICQYCGACLPNFELLKDHLYKVHQLQQTDHDHLLIHNSDEYDDNYEKDIKEVEMFHCEQCDKYFSSKQSLRNHLVSHTDRFRCSTCLQGFSCQKFLDQHTRNKDNCERLIKKRKECSMSGANVLDASNFVEAVIHEDNCTPVIVRNNNYNGKDSAND